MITSEALSLDRTSEGICTSKFILSLQRAGYIVHCLTSEVSMRRQSEDFYLPWLNSIPISHIEHFTSPIQKVVNPHNKFTNIIGASFAYLTGWNFETWRQVRLWRNSLESIIDRFNPDLIFVRGAGTNFCPHLAMTMLNPKIPWVANYHDPFPISLYPEPYRHQRFLLSSNQESWNQRILNRATALTFPSERLLKWELKKQKKTIHDKSFVIPHLVSEVPGRPLQIPDSLKFDPKNFNLLHMGTLLGPRNPNILYTALLQFCAKSDERKQNTRLYLVGALNKTHQSKNDLLDQLIKIGILTVYPMRIDYHASMQLAKKSDVLILLESNSIESPFFPAKLTDYLYLRKPILAITPRLSTTRDILGQEYPLYVEPNLVDEMENKLEELWKYWKRGDLERLLPSQSILDYLSASEFKSDFERIFTYCMNKST